MEELHELAKRILPYTIHLTRDIPGLSNLHSYLSHCCFTTARVMALVCKHEKPGKRLDDLIHEIINSPNHVFFVDCFDESLNIGHSFTIVRKDDRFGIIHSNLNESYQVLEEMELPGIVKFIELNYESAGDIIWIRAKFPNNLSADKIINSSAGKKSFKLFCNIQNCTNTSYYDQYHQG
jgi:hypothetical protein